MRQRIVINVDGPPSEATKRVRTPRKGRRWVRVATLEEVRDATWMPGTFARALMISSVIPSLKYSFSGSALMLASGRTAMALRAGEPGGVLPAAWSQRRAAWLAGHA